MQEYDREFKKLFEQTQHHLGKAEPGWKSVTIKIEGNNFAETTCDPSARQIIVRVTEATVKYPVQRTYQLIHESVHCLCPRNRRGSEIEIGAASDQRVCVVCFATAVLASRFMPS
jgi:hypothetical protein